jgi:hypothetical protein
MSYLQSVKASWDEIKTAFKKKYTHLKEEDLKYEEGKEEEFYEKLEKKLGVERAEIDKFLKEHHESIQKKTKK